MERNRRSAGYVMRAERGRTFVIGLVTFVVTMVIVGQPLLLFLRRLFPGVALLPLLIVVVTFCALLSSGSLIVWRVVRRPPTLGHCRTCGYDLTGNVSGICPECGTRIGPGEGCRES